MKPRNPDPVAARMLAGRRALQHTPDPDCSPVGSTCDMVVRLEDGSHREFCCDAAELEIRHGVIPTPHGPACLAWTPHGICALEFTRSQSGGPGRPSASVLGKWPGAHCVNDPAGAARRARTLFRQPPELHLRGTSFQIRIWLALLRVPRGTLVTYQDLAKAVGNPRAARAAGSAVGSNSVAVLIPCHRVIRANGETGEYRWGSTRKKILLESEKSEA